VVEAHEVKESYLQRVRVPNIDRVVKGPRDEEAGVDRVPRNGRDGELVGACRSPERREEHSQIEEKKHTTDMFEEKATIKDQPRDRLFLYATCP
jgi:hypothetical protein